MTQLSVSEFLAFLNEAMRTVSAPGEIAILGEVAEYKMSQGKWVWFKLKDEAGDGVLDCFWTTFAMNVPLADGMKVRIFGFPKVHPRSGKFSYNVLRAELVGEGALKRAYDLLKKKLAEEGLFAIERKRALPRFPQTIGLITSSDAAAYTDFLRIVSDRFGGLEILFTPVAVQGEQAVSEITSAFRWFNALAKKPDVIVLTRGGGSLEDLAAFNSEEIARAVYRSIIPVICGVGHERDESLADFVADVRASTPTNAAERVVPDRRELIANVCRSEHFLDDAIREMLQRFSDRLDDTIAAMERFFVGEKEALGEFVVRIQNAYERRRALVAERVSSLDRLLTSLNPTEQLKRGWSIAMDVRGRVIRSADTVDKGDVVSVRLWRGGFQATVVERQKELRDAEQAALL